MVFSDIKYGGHSRAAERCDAPAVSVRHLGNVAMSMKPPEQSSDSSCLAAGQDRVSGGARECLADLTVAEAGDEVLTAENSGEEPGVVRIGGVEAAMATGLGTDRLSHAVKSAAGGAGIVDMHQGIEIAPIGGTTDPFDSARAFGGDLGMALEPTRRVQSELLEVLELDPPQAQEVFQTPRVADRQVSFEDHAVEARQGSQNSVAMLHNKAVHGALPPVCGVSQHHHAGTAPWTSPPRRDAIMTGR